MAHYGNKMCVLLGQIMAEPSPSPTPERAIYGFVLYLSSWFCLAVYILWAYVPDKWLHALGLTYWPQKYWAIAGPTYLCVALLFGILFYVGSNFLITPSLNSMSTITDSHTRSVQVDNLPVGAIPPIGDMLITEVNQLLYYET